MWASLVIGMVVQSWLGSELLEQMVTLNFSLVGGKRLVIS